MPSVTLPARFRYPRVRISPIRSPRGGGRANRSTGRRGRPPSRRVLDPLASRGGQLPAGLGNLAAAGTERFLHRALRGARKRLAEAPRRSGASAARRRLLRALPAARGPAAARDRCRAPPDERQAPLLPRPPGREGRAHLPDAEVPHARARRRGAPRLLSRRRARREDTRRDHAARPPSPRDAARRASPALERPQRRHELRRAAADPAPFLRAARGGAAGLLAASRRAARV